MIKAKQGLLERQSLEENALIAQGAEILTNCKPSRFPIKYLNRQVVLQCTHNHQYSLVLDRALLLNVLLGQRHRVFPFPTLHRFRVILSLALISDT